MKKASIFLLAVLALTTGAFARSDFEITNIQTNFVNTPQINFTGNAKSVGSPQIWLEVEVEFKAYPPITEELTFKYYTYIDGKCLTGTVTHVNLAKGLKFMSVMYVSPSTLYRVANGKPSKTVQEVTVQILNNKGEVVAEKSQKGTQGQWWAKLDQTSGRLLNKNETPFASLYWDRYAEIKPESH